MKRSFFVLLTLALLVLPNTSSAGVLERDWENAPSGNGLLTFDDVNNREWLDLTESQIGTFPGEQIEDRVQSVLAELEPGGLFEGFTLANRDDAIALAQSAGIDTTVFDLATNEVPTQNLIDLMGELVSFPELSWSAGFIDEFVGLPPDARRVAALMQVDDRPINPTGFGFTVSDDFIGASGVMLYRAIPEPSAAALMSLCLASLAALRH